MKYLDALLAKESTVDTAETTCRRDRAGHNYCEEKHTCWVCMQSFDLQGECERCHWKVCTVCGACACTLTKDKNAFQLLEGLAKQFCYCEENEEFKNRKAQILKAAFIIARGREVDTEGLHKEEYSPNDYEYYLLAYSESSGLLRRVFISMARTFLACAHAEEKMEQHIEV